MPVEVHRTPDCAQGESNQNPLIENFNRTDRPEVFDADVIKVAGLGAGNQSGVGM